MVTCWGVECPILATNTRVLCTRERHMCLTGAVRGQAHAPLTLAWHVCLAHTPSKPQLTQHTEEKRPTGPSS